ncbi:glycoside hydrolase family 5 protein [Aureimonas pseudogalii]|uniref:Endoglucanase n=1 Tax=Aureimonas pseudogalii TaxID=1744844 RepID=A0A7W6H4R6_9HYPH|nr:glycoside hydrolase family 5 protein [Aureimonas pseudogalii]MBB3997894.1 endoglucanase [Aureimonas pseudogalii]
MTDATRREFVLGLLASTVAAGPLALTGPAFAQAPMATSGRPLTWDEALAGHRYGVALAGLEFGEKVFPGRLNAEIVPPQPDRYAYYASKGLKTIRLPYLWERFQPELFGDIDGRVDLLSTDRHRGVVLFKDLVREQLDLAEQHGIKVLLDPHNYGARALRRDGRWLVTGGTGRGGRFAIGSPDVPVEAFADFVGKLAAEFADHPALMGFDIMNEPTAMPEGPDSWFAAAQAAIDSIRDVSPDVLIFVEGYHYANPFNWQKLNPRLHELKDPSDKLVFSAHLYFDGDHSGRYQQAEARAPLAAGTGRRAVDDIEPFFRWLDEHGLRGHIGEFGTPDTPEWADAVENFVDACRQREIVVHAWADWPGVSNYVLQLNPQGGPDKRIVTLLSEAARALN